MINNRKILLPIITFIVSIIWLSPCTAQRSDFSGNLLSDDEFNRIVSEASIFKTKCNDDYSALKTHDWSQKVNKIKIYLKMDKYINNILKKLRNKAKVSNLTSRNWSKYEKAQIQFNGSLCRHKATYRLTGDFNDHVGAKDQLPHSIKIKLKSGNVGSITKFKLLKPDTRGGKFELLNVLIHKKLGFIAPRTALVDVHIGGNVYQALFQEDISKNLLENNNLHESFIIEGDEGYAPLTNPKISNLKLIDGVHIEKIANSVLKKISKVYLETNNFSLKAKLNPNSKIHATDPPLLIDFLPENSKSNFISFHLLNYALQSSGGLTRDDHRMAYDIISREFFPIFYDGHYRSYEHDDLLVNFKFSTKERNLLIENLNKIDISDLLFESQKHGAVFNKNEISNILQNAISFLTSVSMAVEGHTLQGLRSPESYIERAGKQLVRETDSGKLQVSWRDTNEKLKTCLIAEGDIKCDLSSNNNSNYKPKFYFNPQSPETGLFIHGLGATKSTPDLFDSLAINSFQIQGTGSTVEHTQNLKLVIDPTEKTIKIVRVLIDNQTSQVKISGGFLEGWDIQVQDGTSLGYVELAGSRASEFGLTGCLTLSDIKLSLVNLFLERSNCEDGVHFVRAVGNLKNLFVSNAKYDGIDADFSNLEFENITVQNSGNDCFDISSGKYTVATATFDGCKDKGISSGEAAEVKIDKISISNALFGLVSKDESKVNVTAADIDNSKVCIAVYRKKQEFGGASLTLGPKIRCNGAPSYFQHGSNILHQ
mgnify:CR=1 FL=1